MLPLAATRRLTSLAHDLTSSNNDLTHSFSYTPASQIASLTRSNGAYAWGGHVNVSRAYINNGLNQVTQSGSVSIGHDATGYITSAGTSSSAYNSRNLMTSGTGVTALQWDPLNRLYMVLVGTTETKFQYDGQRMIAEFDTAGYMLRRYVHGPGVDEPLVWYEGSGTSDRRWLHADERGSIVAVTDGTGAVMTNGINTYDSYGIPGATNLGRFGYTGQAWIPELGMWYYKARIYSPTLGRFMQPDPIGYGDGMNLYAYVRGDPVNARDPSGMACSPSADPNDIIVCGGRDTAKCVGLPHKLFAAIGCYDNVIVPNEAYTTRESGGGERGGAGVPGRVRVDESCRNVPAANDSRVQQAALAALRRSIATGAEHGFFVFERTLRPGGYVVGNSFSSGHARGITRGTVEANLPGWFGASWSGHSSSPALFIHAHHNNAPPSPIGRDDRESAAERGFPYAAIDRAGNLTCSVTQP